MTPRAKLAQQVPREFHREFLLGFIICAGIAIFLGLFYTFISYNPLAWAGVAASAIGAVIFSRGISMPSETAIIQKIKSSIIEVLQNKGPLLPDQVALKLDWQTAVTLDAIQVMVEEHELRQDVQGKVSLPP